MGINIIYYKKVNFQKEKKKIKVKINHNYIL